MDDNFTEFVGKMTDDTEEPTKTEVFRRKMEKYLVEHKDLCVEIVLNRLKRNELF